MQRIHFVFPQTADAIFNLIRFQDTSGQLQILSSVSLDVFFCLLAWLTVLYAHIRGYLYYVFILLWFLCDLRVVMKIRLCVSWTYFIGLWFYDFCVCFFVCVHVCMCMFLYFVRFVCLCMCFVYFSKNIL